MFDLVGLALGGTSGLCCHHQRAHAHSKCNEVTLSPTVKQPQLLKLYAFYTHFLRSLLILPSECEGSHMNSALHPNTCCVFALHGNAQGYAAGPADSAQGPCGCNPKGSHQQRPSMPWMQTGHRWQLAWPRQRFASQGSPLPNTLHLHHSLCTDLPPPLSAAANRSVVLGSPSPPTPFLCGCCPGKGGGGGGNLERGLKAMNQPIIKVSPQDAEKFLRRH